MFYCFGCGAAGDVINFVRKISNTVDYVEAVKLLRAAPVWRMPEEDDQTSRSRSRLLYINRNAARYFSRLNAQRRARPTARATGARRGLSDAAIRRFGLGYAPDSFRRDAGSSAIACATAALPKPVLAAGLVKRSEKGHLYDIFRHRVMMPIFDLRGNIIAFGGRVMDLTPSRKYINSPETMVYQKPARCLPSTWQKNPRPSGISCARVYGCISMHQAGFDTASVAGCGTALTPEQVKLLSEYADEVVLSYDSDEAGQKATRAQLRPVFGLAAQFAGAGA